MFVQSNWLPQRLISEGLVTGPLSESINNSGLSAIKRRLLGHTSGLKIAAHYLDFGTELHRRLLEPRKRPHMVFSLFDLNRLNFMEASLRTHTGFAMLLRGAQTERLRRGVIDGVKVHGTLDIVKPKLRIGGDIKTTSTRSHVEFITSAIGYDYLRQAWVYCKIAKLDSFIFYGIQKQPPYQVFELDVANFAHEFQEAEEEARFLLDFYKRYGTFINPMAA
jgi:hypothetical protein